MKLIRTLYHSDGNYLECKHCHNLTELYRTTGKDPQKLMEVREAYEERHSTDSGCCGYALQAAMHDMERKEPPCLNYSLVHGLGRLLSS